MTSTRTVWITGAGSGLGRALAERFAMNGDTVILSGRRASNLQAAARAIRAAGGSCSVVPLDVRNEASVNRAARKILQGHKSVDILVNNAGTTAFKDVRATSVREFENIVSTNLIGSYRVTKSVLPAMLKQKRGIILNIISYAAKTVYTGSAAYTASKTGTAAMMNVLREEVRGKGIRVVNVYPGAVDTPIWSAQVRKKYSPAMMTAWEVSSMIYEATVQKPNVGVEELVIRPAIGDLRV